MSHSFLALMTYDLVLMLNPSSTRRYQPLTLN